MTRLSIALLLALSAAPALAEGPGTRIRSGSELPRLLESLPRDPANPCARLHGNARQRCLDEQRRAARSGTALASPRAAIPTNRFSRGASR